MSGRAVRVATYNVRGLKDDRAAVVRVIRAICPDVLCLQEAPRHPGSGHRVAALAADTGLTWADGQRGRMSTTVFTSLRLDVRSTTHVNLPVRRFDEPRGYAAAVLRLPAGQSFVVASVHLSLRQRERPDHARRVLDAVIGDVPVIVAGDFNETDTEPAWAVFAKVLTDAGPRLPTCPPFGLGRRIDTVFVGAGLRATVPTLDLAAADLRAASDHLPVVVDVELPPTG